MISTHARMVGQSRPKRRKYKWTPYLTNFVPSKKFKNYLNKAIFQKCFSITVNCSPTLEWYQGDESKYVQRVHGNSVRRNTTFVPSKPSNGIQLEKIATQSKEKPHIIYKNFFFSSRVFKWAESGWGYRQGQIKLNLCIYRG